MQKLLNDHLKLTHVFVLLLSYTTLAHTYAAQAEPGIARHNTDDPRITVDFNNVALAEALQTVGTKSGYGITYNDADLAGARHVTYKAENALVTDVVARLLAGTRLAYKEYKNSIVIYVLPPPKKEEPKGSIQGMLYDVNSGEALIGANVLIVGTTFGSATNIEGRYSIANVPPGIYTLAISYLGYETSVVRDVRVASGQATTLDFKLKPSSTQLQDIEIIGNKALSGNVIETNELAMINDIKTSPLIITGISAQQISRSVDQDAGEVARRLPGVTLLNNFVNIRGMHERYNLTYLNGMIAPSSEADRRAFSYDLLPSNMIDKMTVYRSPAPELLADWSGGVIKVETKNTSIARQIEVNFSTWYRPGSNFKDYYTSGGESNDWLAKDDGSRGLPKGFPIVGGIPAGGLGTTGRNPADYSTEDLAANANLARKLINKRDLMKKHSGLDYRAGINYYNAWHLGKMRLSNLTSINATFATQITNQLLNPLREIDGDGFARDLQVWQDTISRRSARWGVLQNLTLQINPRHRIEVKGIYNRLGVDETYVRKGQDQTFEWSADTLTKVIYYYRSRAILSMQLAGDHYLDPDKHHHLQWTACYSSSEEDVPAQRQVGFSKDAIVPAELYQFSLYNGLYYVNSTDKNPTFILDYEYKLPAGVFFRAGVFNEYKDKNFDSRLITIGKAPSTVESGQPTLFNIGSAFSPSIFTEDGNGAYIFDNQYLSGQYSFTGKIYAGYGAVNVPLFDKKLNIYGGLRYERQDVLLEVPKSNPYLIGRNPTIIDRYRDYLLPSVNASWSFTDKLLVRAAYGKTINRPNYREMIPTYILDPRLDLWLAGNDSLKDATIHNLDLRLEYYPSDGEFVSVGTFYKKLNNAIEPYSLSGGNNEIRYDNTPDAVMYGVEAEVRKSLRSIPVSWLKSFSTIANLTFLHSEVKFRDGLLPSKSNNYGDFRIATRPLEGTAKYVVNVGLYYEQENWGTKISALYNVLGQRLVFAGTDLYPETYELPRHVIDLTLRQRVNKYIEIRAGVQDILNQYRRLYRDWDRNKTWDPDLRNKLPYRDWIFQKYRTGSYFMLGVNFTL